ncbi:hypothetical protein HNQ44_001320 [Planomicrobium koreense]|jgi:hypothetical protein|uniref:Uncharacterized protein n=1 Tax=Planococcus koreensis TaxID=112331 RepID=A0A7W8CR45_9BACL|nr:MULTISPECIES: hypothetical protein [Planococcus]MBB5179896.1 hypothetical protein [Planococcus koreensis]MDN3450645.1 hypothetical protein [Planococcus sp. APC 3906]
MHYQLNLQLSRMNKDYYWLFRSEENTITVFNEVLETFKQYEPQNAFAFMQEAQREIEETGTSNTVHIEVVKVDRKVIIRSASYNGMSYDDRYFQEIYNILTERLGVPEEETAV